jgi:hypothetical protein
MKISDIFRQVADAIDQQEDPGHPDDLIQNPATLDPVYSATGVSNMVAVEPQDNTVDDPEDLFLSPLQMKLELLKKAVGVDNVYDDGADSDCNPGCDVSTKQYTDDEYRLDLAQMKKSAGLNEPVVSELAHVNTNSSNRDCRTNSDR